MLISIISSRCFGPLLGGLWVCGFEWSCAQAKRDEAFAETRACSKDLDELAKIVDGEFSLKNKKTGFDRTKLENPRKSALDHVLNIETLMAPDKLPFRIPARYDHLPRLTGLPFCTKKTHSTSYIVFLPLSPPPDNSPFWRESALP